MIYFFSPCNLFLPLLLSREDKTGFCFFFVQPDNFFLLIGAVRLFTFIWLLICSELNISSCYLFSICPICSLFQFSSFYGFKNYAYFMILLYLLCSSLAIALVILVVYNMHLVYYTICQVILYHFPMLYKRLKLVTFISPS